MVCLLCCGTHLGDRCPFRATRTIDDDSLTAECQRWVIAIGKPEVAEELFREMFNTADQPRTRRVVDEIRKLIQSNFAP
jgi:hypothetical protein